MRIYITCTSWINGESFEVPTTEEKQRITDLLRSALNLKQASTGNTLSDSAQVDVEGN